AHHQQQREHRGADARAAARGRPAAGPRRRGRLAAPLALEAHLHGAEAAGELALALVDLDRLVGAHAHGLGVEAHEVAGVDVLGEALVVALLQGAQVVEAHVGALGDVGQLQAALDARVAQQAPELADLGHAGVEAAVVGGAHAPTLPPSAAKAVATCVARRAFSSSSRRFTATVRPSESSARAPSRY